MPTVYYNGFDTVRVDADGFRIPLVSETFTVKKVPEMTGLGTVESDEFGTVADGSVTTTADTLIEFSHATYPDVFLRTVAASIEAAAGLPANAVPTFVAENLNTGETAAASVEIWMHDNDNPDAPDQFLGHGTPGETAQFPYLSTVGRDLTFYGNPVTTAGERKFLRHEDGPFADLETASAPGGAAGSFVFSETVDATELVNVYNDGGVAKIRLADASVTTKEAHGFAPASVLATEEGSVYFIGNIIEGLAGLTPGADLYLSETPGEITETPPLVVSQRIGTALSTTTAIFAPHPADISLATFLTNEAGDLLTNEAGDYLTGE